MKITSRELMLGWTTLMIVLVAGSYWFVAPKIKEGRDLSGRQETVRREIELSKRLLDQKPDWERRMDQLRFKLKTYSLEKDVSADYMKLLESLAKESELALLQRRPEKEKKQGDLFEFAVDCTWEGNLNALIRFLYALESQDVSMDLDQLSVSPISGGKGKLKGNFTLKCAYCRAADSVPDSNPAVNPEQDQAVKQEPGEAPTK